MTPRQLHRSTLDELLRLAYGIRRQASTNTFSGYTCDPRDIKAVGILHYRGRITRLG
jgi:hypothetical protein